MIPFLQAILGDMISLVAVAAILAGIIKAFQMSTSLNEIKDLLVEIKRNTQDYSSANPSAGRQAPEPVVRPVGSGSEADAIIRAAVLAPEK